MSSHYEIELINTFMVTMVYACFVDFRKTFDSVLHDGLLYKLLQYNVGGKFFSLIKSLYANFTCSVRLGSKKHDLFNTQEAYAKAAS